MQSCIGDLFIIALVAVIRLGSLERSVGGTLACEAASSGCEAWWLVVTVPTVTPRVAGVAGRSQPTESAGAATGS